MKIRLSILFIVFCSLMVEAQNVIIGTNGFLTKNPFAEQAGFGIYTRMGVEVLEIEVGIKSFYGKLGYGKLNEIDAYGVSLYTFVPIYRIKKWEAVAHVEGGLSFVFNEYFGSERALQMGLGPGIRYKLREHFSIELILEYAVFANITQDNPLYTHIIIPTIGWSVRI